MLHLEWLAEGIYDVGFQCLDNDLIIACHSVPPELTPLMRMIVVACEYVCRVARVDVPMEDDDFFKEDDDTNLDDEDGSRYD